MFSGTSRVRFVYTLSGGEPKLRKLPSDNDKTRLTHATTRAVSKAGYETLTNGIQRKYRADLRLRGGKLRTDLFVWDELSKSEMCGIAD